MALEGGKVANEQNPKGGGTSRYTTTTANNQNPGRGTSAPGGASGGRVANDQNPKR